MEMVRATILEGEMDDILWPEVVLAMTHVKNLRPTRALEGSISPAEMQDQIVPSLQNLCVLWSTIYVFLHEEERTLKSAKWDARALKGKLVGFDGHTIYRVHIEEQNRVIRVKDLRIFEHPSAKTISALPDFDGKPTFDGVQLSEEEGLSSKSNSSEDENANKTPFRRSTRPSKPKQTRAGKTVKPTPKAKESGKATKPSNPENTEALITLFVKLLSDDWEEEEKISAFLASIDDNDSHMPDTGLNPLHLLATSIHKSNSTDPGDFVFSTQLDIEEPET